MNIQQVPQNLEWPILVAKLTDKAQTEPGQRSLSKIQPNLNTTEIEHGWAQQTDQLAQQTLLPHTVSVPTE